MKPTRIALVGIGGWSKYHYDRIKEMETSGDVILAAVMIRTGDLERHRDMAETLRAEEIEIFTDYAGMLFESKTKVDLVVIPTGIGDHCAMSIAAMEAGYDVLCEKPVAGTVQECMRMIEAQKKSGKILAICFQNIFSATIRRMKQLALGGTLGALKSAKTMVLWPRADSYYSRSAWGGKLVFQNSTINDCPLMNATAHFLNNMLFIAGKSLDAAAEPVSVYGENYRVKKIESCDTQFLRVMTDTGAELIFMASHSTDIRVDPYSEYFFEHGKMSWWFKGEAVVSRKIGDQYVEVDRFDSGEQEALTAVYLGVREAIRTRARPASIVQNSYQHVLCVEKSLESGPIVDVLSPHVEATYVLADDDCLKAGDVNLIIPDIQPIMERMFSEGLSFYEADCPWAVPSKEVRIGCDWGDSLREAEVEAAV